MQMGEWVWADPANFSGFGPVNTFAVFQRLFTDTVGSRYGTPNSIYQKLQELTCFKGVVPIGKWLFHNDSRSHFTQEQEDVRDAIYSALT